MDIIQALEARHAVRSYTGQKIEGEILAQLLAEIDSCNKEGKMHIQLIKDEPQAFSSTMAHYGKFSRVSNYIALIGPKGADLNEKSGYYGQKIVLKAQQLGLNTCWVALSYKKQKEYFDIRPGEKLTAVISVGYGITQGTPHKSKSAADVSNISLDKPEWFRKGVDAALLAPTALNQQKFYLEYIDGKVKAKAKMGPYADMDLGIVKYNFEIGSGKDSSIWL